VENPARRWRANFGNWRALAGVGDAERGRKLARHGKTGARQRRAEFSTGHREREVPMKEAFAGRRAKCAPETAAALLLLLVIQIQGMKVTG
jgi:hypothetical protein